METSLSNPWVQSAFTMSDEFKGEILHLAATYPQAFMIRPKGFQKPGEAWAQYEFDGSADLWVDLSHRESIEFYNKKFQEEKERTMTTALTTQEQSGVKRMLAANIQAIKSVLPKHLTPEKMLRMAYSSICLQPKLARCSQLSLMNAVIEASSLGLEIGGPLALAHLVPFKNHGRLEAKLMVDYKGLIELIYKSPKVADLTAHPVFANDDFGYRYGLNPNLWHIPYDGDNRGDLTNAYAIVRFIGGGHDFEVVTPKIAAEAKERSAAKNKSDSPWNTSDEWTMWVKTAIRRLAKRVPKSPELQRALVADSAADEGKEQGFNHVIDVDFQSMENANVTDASGGELPPGELETTEPAPEPTDETGPPSEPPEVDEETEKILANYFATKDSFPEDFPRAVKDVGVKNPDSPTVKEAQAVMEKIDSYFR